jgi:hypothetical protein
VRLNDARTRAKMNDKHAAEIYRLAPNFFDLELEQVMLVA